MSFFFGKGKAGHNREPVCGGTTDNSDRSAPKTIASKQLCYLRTRIYLNTRETQNGEHSFDFEVQQGENGAVTARENLHSVCCDADASMLERLQAVIDKYSLALNNGTSRVTAGLPPPYQPCSFEARYASGERISFYINNDPVAQWAEEIYSILTERFAQAGERSLLRKKEDSQIIRLSLSLHKGGLYTRYSDINVPEDEAIQGETLLLCRSVFSAREKKTLSDDYILFPADYFTRLTQIMYKHDVVTKYLDSIYDHKAHNLGNHSKGYFGFAEIPDGDDPDVEGENITIHIKYESGTIINISTAKRGEMDAMQPLVTELLQYLDSLF